MVGREGGGTHIHALDKKVRGLENSRGSCMLRLFPSVNGPLQPLGVMVLEATHLVVREGCSLPWMWIVLSSCMLRRRVAGRLELGRCVVFLLRREQQVVVRPGWLDREGLLVDG